MVLIGSNKEALYVLHFAFPAAVFIYYFVAALVAACHVQHDTREHPRRRLITVLVTLCVVSYVLHVIALAVDAFRERRWEQSQDTTLCYLSCILVFGTQLSVLMDSSGPQWTPLYGSWILALIFEALIMGLGYPDSPSSRHVIFRVIHIAIWAARYVLLISLLVCYFAWRSPRDEKEDTENERQPLLASDSNSGGTTSSLRPPRRERRWERRERVARETMQKKLETDGNWLAYLKRFRVFIPFVWPFHHRALQARALGVILCLLAGNALHLLIPRQLGIVMDSLAGNNSYNPWVQVGLFMALRWMSSEAGIPVLRNWLWLPVQYYSVQTLDAAAYSHILNLSCEFHDSKNSSDLTHAISHGECISDMLESICFHAIPMLIDLGVAFVYLSYILGLYEGFITLTTSVVFLHCTNHLVSGLREYRRASLDAMYEEHYVRLAGIQCWHTVSQFNQISYEENRYSNAVRKKAITSQSLMLQYYINRVVQYMVLLSGLLAGSFLAVYRVLNKEATSGDFVMLLTYWAQLSSPLDFFAGLWKTMAQNLINAERLLDIMEATPSVVNKSEAPALQFRGGSVKFSDVCFTYDHKKSILTDVTFQVEKGQTVAFVGATGAGKSTIFRLLNRFYDVTAGNIEIDGQNIRDVDISSLRSHIGAVPQTPILFNDTIMNNIRYAKLSATDDEVFEACKAACIHDNILEFSDGYETYVGEHGLKLSGGELQRVALARALLKNPGIVMLDEATSAIDTETEERIQSALQRLCEGRTTLVIAHRLSTIMNADRIIVIGDGRVLEQGSHHELLHAKGRYARLWFKQFTARPSSEEEFINDLTPQQTEEANREISRTLGGIEATQPICTSATEISNKLGVVTQSAAPVVH